MRGRKRHRKKQLKKLMRGCSFGFTGFKFTPKPIASGTLLARYTFVVDPSRVKPTAVEDSA